MIRTARAARAAALAAAAALCLSLCSCGKNVKLGTGNDGGIYRKYGNAFAGLESGVNVIVKNTAGSQANLRLLNDGFIDMAIVQSDMLSEAVNGTDDFKGSPVSDVRAVAALYMEDFQIVVRADSDIESIADLAEKRISLGEDGSGVAKNAEYILNSAGISMNMVNTCYMNYQQSAEALKDGEIDAFFAVLGAPADVISQLAEDISIRLLPMDERTAAYMTNLYEGYFSTEIKAGTYSGINEDVPTIGVKAVLVADASADAQTVKKLTAAIFENSGDIEKQGLAAPNSDFATSGLPCAFHKGAVEYYKSINISVNADDN